MRDNYLRTRTLETEKFQTAEFVPRRVQGLTLPLAAAGKTAFQIHRRHDGARCHG